MYGSGVARWRKVWVPSSIICIFYFTLSSTLSRSGGTVNFTLPFMTNMTIPISTSQIFRSWVAIFQPRPPMASLFRSLYGMPGFAPRMDVLSWGLRDFQISFSNRDTSRNAWNRHWGSFMVDTGILSNNIKFPSQMLNDILWPDHIQWQPPTYQTLYRTRPLTKIWEVSIEHLRRVCMPTGDAYSSVHLVPSLLDLHMLYLLRPILFQNCRYFTGLCPSNILGTFSILPLSSIAEYRCALSSIRDA